MSIRSRLVLSFLVLALVPLLIATALSFIISSDAVRNDALKHLETIANFQRERLKTIMSTNVESLDVVSSRTMLKQELDRYLAQPNPASLSSMQSSLDDGLASTESFVRIDVLDTNGTVLASTDRALIGKSRASELYFKRGRAADDVGFFSKAGRNGLHETLAGPLSSNGRTIGVLVIDRDASDILQMANDYTGLGKTGETVVAQKTESGDSVFLCHTRFGGHTPLSLVVPHEKSNVAIDIALDGRSTVLENAVDYRGTPVLAVTRYIPEARLGLVVKMDRSEAFGPVNRLLGYMAIIIGVAVGLVLVVSYSLATSLTRPLRKLTDTAEEVSAGDLSRRSSINRGDEVGTLAKAFDRMADDLVGARENLERKVAERTEELARSNAELEGYAHTVSHDLRGPLANISISVEILQDAMKSGDPESMREALNATDQIAKATEKSFGLIGDLLELAEAGQEPPNVDYVDVRKVVDRALDDLRPRIESKNVRVEIDDDLGTVKANETHIYQLFQNLLSNAVKHNDSAEPSMEVRLLGRDGPAVRYRVCDNGPGISSEDLPRIFTPFFKSGKAGETGVGLAIVQKVVSVYNGTVRAYNDNGACFEFMLRDYEQKQ